MAHNITLYAYYNSCSMGMRACGTDTLSLGFLSEDSYTLEYKLLDVCQPYPVDSLVYSDVLEFDVRGATGINTQADVRFRIYPNPADDQLFIESSELVQKFNLEIYNLTGQLVMNRTFQSTSYVDLDISGLTNGIYVLKVTTDKGIYNSRVIVQ
jgi:hypothetical protein